MKVILLLFLLTLTAIGSHAQGWLAYSNTPLGVSKEKYVFNNEGGTISDWQQASERGKSRAFNHELAGVAADGSPHLGTGSTYNGLTYFSLAIPEPSGMLLAGVAVGLFAVRLRRMK
ncbi:MAG: hypothetical protein JNN07_10795 [Verrucomicrobiales bacterium]|nr:hypothetical protein [Verrucomicrobiales bacterium]